MGRHTHTHTHTHTGTNSTSSVTRGEQNENRDLNINFEKAANQKGETRLNDMAQKYRTTIREKQNLNSWSAGLGPAVILSTTWWTWVAKHGPAILIKALRYQFCSQWIKAGLVGRHRASKLGATDSRQTSLVSDKVKWMGQRVPVFPIIYTHLHIIN